MDCKEPSEKLCDTCREFNPAKGNFVTNYGTLGSLPGFLGVEYDATGLGSCRLGFLDEIYRRRSSCSFCWLIFSVTHSSDRGNIGYDGVDRDGGRVSCHLEWQLDGRLLDESHTLTTNAITRRLRVFNPRGLFADAQVMLLGTDSPETNAVASFLAREIQTTHVDISRLRKWLDLCIEHHAGSCGPNPSIFWMKSSRLRFIDVQDRRLVDKKDIEAEGFCYATLSYVWGRERFFTLMKCNFHQLHEPDSIGDMSALGEALPRTIRDAIYLVKSLGLRYVWIDSLCIVQDDLEEWMYMSAIMDRIYANGILNICCAAGDGVGSGIPGTIQTLRNTVQPVISVCGTRLVASRTVESLIGQSTWSSRAWTFQERMLSRRCLIFADDRVFCKCRQATWSEEVDSECSARAWTLDFVKSPFRSLERNPLRFYTDYVEMYSERKLTEWSDRLMAFMGLASVLCPPLKATLFFALPHSHFDFALLWDRRSPGSRVVTKHEPEFPSWSWCGWEGACTWRIYMVSSSLLNLHDWLKHHTWIVWYASWDINVESGECKEAALYNLREWSWGLALVWNPANNSDDHPDRWHGYASTCEVPYGRHDPPFSTENLPTRPTSTTLENRLLYFWTWTAFFQLSRKSLSSREFPSSLEPGLHRFGIGDIKGNWCGTIVLEEKWFNQVEGIFEFVAISEARDFSMEELDTWNYYIPEDREMFEWYVVYALMIVWDETHTVAERVGLAKIYQKAFHTGSFQPGKAWREIVLG